MQIYLLFSGKGPLAISLASISVSIIMQYVCFEAVPQMTFDKYTGRDSKIRYTVQECVSFSSYNSIYKIRINEIDGKRTALNGLLTSDFETDLSVGETGYVIGYITENESIGDSFISRLSFASEGRFLKIEAGRKEALKTEIEAILLVPLLHGSGKSYLQL